MNRIETAIPGVYILEPEVHGDERGFFLESYNERTFAAMGITTRFVQDNHSASRANVLRGLHYQLVNPQAKLVRVIKGEVFDVAVDLRRGSPTFGQWVGTVLSAENKGMLFVPEGFAHGFFVQSERAEFMYKCSDFYNSQGERGIIWNDPDIGIDWPIPEGVTPILSEKDTRHAPLKSVPEDELPS